MNLMKRGCKRSYLRAANSGEVTPDSDADWILLIDGQAQPNHFEVAQNIADRVQKVIEKAPGREGVFGNFGVQP